MRETLCDPFTPQVTRNHRIFPESSGTLFCSASQLTDCCGDLLAWIRTGLIRISGSGGEEDGQEQAYGGAEHRCAKQVEAGRTVDDVDRECGVSQAAIYTSKAKFGGMDVSEAQRLRSLEDENSRLKRLVADLSLDKEMLKAGIAKKGLSS